MYKKYQLKNGLTVILVESHKSPVVSVQMWVRTGSADEKKGEEGLSHFIEHLVFKGTKNFGVGEIASTIEGRGGQLNAYTSFDQTVFYVTISKAFAENGLEAISEMMGFPLFDEVEIDNEREVVIEEIKRGLDNPHRQASRELFSTVYKKHPYRLPVIGFEENIRKVSRETIVDYYNSRYVPENMTLLVVGDFNSVEMKTDVKKYFSTFEKLKLKKVKRHKEPTQEKSRMTIKSSDFKESLFYISWPLPTVKHGDIPAVDVMALILGQGDSSRLVQNVRLEKGLVNHIGASSFTPQDRGFFAVSGSTSPDRLDSALLETAKVINDFFKDPPSVSEMQKALINFNSDDFYSVETVDGMASKVGTYEHLFNDYRYHEKFMKQVNTLTAKDIQKVARKYLKPDKVSMVLMTSGPEDAGKKIFQNFKKTYKKNYEKLKPAKVPKWAEQKTKASKWFSTSQKHKYQNLDKIEKVSLPGGGRAYFRRDSSTKLVSAKMAFLGGVRVEPQEQLGLTELFSKTWGRATKTFDENSLSAKVESMASSLSSFAGRNTFGLSMTSLPPFSDQIFELFEDMAFNSVFDPTFVEREKKAMVEHLKMRDDNPAQIAVLNFQQEIFKGHPYARDLSGTLDSIPKLSPKDLQSFLEIGLSASNMTAVITGNFDLDVWKNNIKNLATHLPQKKFESSVFHVDAPKSSVQKFIESQKEQSHIILGYPGLTFTSEERFALQLMQSVLAGQGGRLFMELRDKESLAYSVAPLRMEGIDTGYFGAYIGCSPEKGGKAIDMMKIEFQKLVDALVPSAELQRSKRYLIGRHDIELQRNSSVASAILFDVVYGLDPGEAFRFAERINSVTANEIREIAEKIFKSPEVAICVGPESPFL